MPPAETIRVFGTERPLNEEDSPAAPRSHVLTLGSELRRSGPVVAIGPARLGTAGAPRVDVLFLEPTDADWFAVFETISLGSSAIVLLPGETRGVIQEIASLRSRGLLWKLILIMPPLRRRQVTVPWLRMHTEHIARGWETVREGFRTLDVVLPDYHPQGLVFALDDTGAVRESVPLAGSFVRIGRAVRTLLPADGHPSARPLREIMIELQGFDLARSRCMAAAPPAGVRFAS